MANYTFDIKVDGIEEILTDIDDIYKLFKKRKFKEFIATKCIETLQKICDGELSEIPDRYIHTPKLEEYKKNHKYEISSDYVEIYNSTILNPDEMVWVSDDTAIRYPDGLSIAHVIEYGTGLRGISSEDWDVNVPSPSKNKDGKWAFKKDGIVYKNQSGMEGKFIYLKLIQEVEKSFDNWVNEYLDGKE